MICHLATSRWKHCKLVKTYILLRNPNTYILEAGANARAVFRCMRRVAIRSDTVRSRLARCVPVVKKRAKFQLEMGTNQDASRACLASAALVEYSTAKMRACKKHSSIGSPLC